MSHHVVVYPPISPPKGGGGNVPKAIEPEDLVEGQGVTSTIQVKRGADFQEAAAIIAAAIENTDAFAHMRVNRRNLMRHLIPIFKKNCAAECADKPDDGKAEALGREILAGLAAWTEKWAADGWQYAPGKITKWLADEKWLEKPRKKTAPAEGSGCGDCGAQIA